MERKINTFIVIAVLIIIGSVLHLYLRTEPEEPTFPPDFFERWQEETENSDTGLANPASVYCQKQGGILEIMETPEGTTGYCVFSDGRKCEEWDFFYSQGSECQPPEEAEETEEKEFASLDECQAACDEAGYENSGCLSLSDTDKSFLNLGSCPAEYCESCGEEPEEQNCCCWNEIESEENEQKCGIENCHGLDVICGPNVPDVCTMVYMFGDICRQFAECKVVEGECQFVESSEFESCKSCVEKCLEDFSDDSIKLFQCEGECAD